MARWLRLLGTTGGALEAPSARPAPAAYTRADLQGLPEPVARYFRYVLSEGQPIIAAARIAERGEFRLGKGAGGWRAFTATQRVVTDPPGFVWDARIALAPLVGVRVRDGYVRGVGSMRAAILGVVPVLSDPGSPEVTAGALQRHLAEAAWFPTALLPRQGVAWRALDDRTAEATLTDGGTTASLQFRFDPEGAITEVFAPARFREVEGRYEATPWAGRFGRYEVHGGIRIPTEAEVEWRLPAGPYPYFRGRVVGVEYRIAW